MPPTPQQAEILEQIAAAAAAAAAKAAATAQAQDPGATPEGISLMVSAGTGRRTPRVRIGDARGGLMSDGRDIMARISCGLKGAPAG